jgi:hypothetical protein
MCLPQEYARTKHAGSAWFEKSLQSHKDEEGRRKEVRAGYRATATNAALQKVEQYGEERRLLSTHAAISCAAAPDSSSCVFAVVEHACAADWMGTKVSACSTAFRCSASLLTVVASAPRLPL